MSQFKQNNPNPELLYINSMLNKTMQNRDLAVVLFKKLFQELPEQIFQIENSLNKAELSQARTIVHKLHGSVSFCGFNELQAQVNSLEISLLTNNLPQAQHDFLHLKQTIIVFQNLQEKILNQLEK
jgi:HPt (histidine-containing phosphotransfer) domain-containing protein